MHILNLFIIPIILLSLFYKKPIFAYVISLLASLGAATFIYRQESLLNILFTIAIFNTTPLVCYRFKQVISQYRLGLEEKKVIARKTHEQMSKELSAIKQSNAQLNTEVFRISELYKVTRDMSQALGIEDAFNILGKKIMELYRFQKCRMILMNDQAEPAKISRVFELEYPQGHVRQRQQGQADQEILSQSLRSQRISYNEEKSTALVPIMAEGKSLGALAIEGLPVNALENFSILADQFFLEFKRVRLYQKIQELAITDGLTNLFVRRYFLQRLQEEIDRSSEHNLQLGFLMIDIDHFKECNDRFGHLAGDAILKEVARTLKALVREIDLVARFGGEEFAVLLPGTDSKGAELAAERIRSGIDRHSFCAYAQMIKIEVSIGVATFPGDATATQALIDKADQALYRAKQAGRNQVCLVT